MPRPPRYQFNGHPTPDVSMPPIIEWTPGMRWMSVNALSLCLQLRPKLAKQFVLALGVPIIKWNKALYFRYEFLLLIVAFISAPRGPRQFSINDELKQAVRTKVKDRLGLQVGPNYDSIRSQILEHPDVVREAVNSISVGLNALTIFPDKDLAPHLLAAWRSFVDLFSSEQLLQRRPDLSAALNSSELPKPVLNNAELHVYKQWKHLPTDSYAADGRTVAPHTKYEPPNHGRGPSAPCRIDRAGNPRPSGPSDPVVLRPRCDKGRPERDDGGLPRPSELPRRSDAPSHQRPQDPFAAVASRQGAPRTGPPNLKGPRTLSRRQADPGAQGPAGKPHNSNCDVFPAPYQNFPIRYLTRRPRRHV